MGHLRRVHADALCGHGAQLQRFYRLPALYPLTLWVQQHAVLAAHHGALPFLHRWNDDGGAHLPPIHPARHRGHGRAARGLLAAALCRDERVPGLLPSFRHGRLRLFLGGDRAHLAAHRPLVPRAPRAGLRHRHDRQRHRHDRHAAAHHDPDREALPVLRLLHGSGDYGARFTSHPAAHPRPAGGSGHAPLHRGRGDEGRVPRRGAGKAPWTLAVVRDAAGRCDAGGASAT